MRFSLILVLIFSVNLWAQDLIQTEYERQLFEQIRCLVCQNQSLADSQAPLAIDLRREVRELIELGYSEEQIFDYLTQRYGDFVLYRPRFNAVNAILWLGPACMLFIAIFGFIRVTRTKI